MPVITDWPAGRYIDKGGYLPMYGEGDSLASQIVTAACRIGYRYINDGDMVRRRRAYYVASPANWLTHHVAGSGKILRTMSAARSPAEYETALNELMRLCMDEGMLARAANSPTDGSIFRCAGTFRED